PGSVHPYGQRPGEINYSIGRAALNRVLVSAAERAGVMLRFEHRCLGLEPESRAVLCIEARSGRTLELDCETIIAADGAGSAVRASLAAAGACTVRVVPLDHDYKEMTLPALGATHALEPDVLHVWPRGGFMLIALPNPDGTFTVTLFLPRTGEPSFAALADEVALRAF
ncbi:Kynurenine 3-monooxygenase, partial [mine drainage metagenome]